MIVRIHKSGVIVIFKEDNSDIGWSILGGLRIGFMCCWNYTLKKENWITLNG